MPKPKKRICIVVASRANYGRIKSVLRAIQDHPKLELQLVVGASALLDRFGSAVDNIERDGFRIDRRVYMVLEGQETINMAKSTGIAITELATTFDSLNPDTVLTVADRYETMSTAVAASYMNICLAHTQGGEVTGSIDESVRHAITKLAHIHFPSTELSAERLKKMGEEAGRIFCTGCPSLDILEDIDLSVDAITKLSLTEGVGAEINFRKPYLVVLQHPVTTEYGSGTEQIQETLAAIRSLKMPTVWFWPNVDAGTDDISRAIRIFREEHHNDEYPFRFCKNYPVEDYARLINNCACIVGNSSSAIREGSFLGVPAVNIGTRQQGREHGQNLMIVDYNRDQIIGAIKKQLRKGRYPRETIFGDGHAGKRIANILAKASPAIQKKLTY